MVEFYEGTLDTLMNRLCNSISSFDKEWVKHCVPATEEQIQQLQAILAEYHYTIPAAYLYYLRRMGQDDNGLLERELDSEADISTVLELQDDKDLEKGLFNFCYSSYNDIYFYMKLSSMNDNPSVVTDHSIVTDIESKNTESFEKYLFQRAFHMYQQSLAYSIFKSSSVCHEKKDKEDCKTCLLYGITVEERMDLLVRTAESYGVKKAWFSDQIHFICYNSNYAFEINVYNGYSIAFYCNDNKLLEQVRYSLHFLKFLYILSKF